MKYGLRFSGKQFSVLKAHLYPGDKCEAVALALCGRHEYKDKHYILVHELHLINYENCGLRTNDQVQWSTDGIESLLEKAEKKGLAVLKVHSHPSGYSDFSDTDDISDKDLFSSVHGWIDDDKPHISAIMLPDGEIIARVIHSDNTFSDVSEINVAGDDIKYWGRQKKSLPEYMIRTQQTFGKKTTSILNSLTAVVVGASGTGGPTIEQLVRNHIGTIIIVDPKNMELKNLNRIPNTKKIDAINKTPKVFAIKNSLDDIDIGTEVIAIHGSIKSKKILKMIACADVVFGCVDSISARDILNQLATQYLLPYFDLGIKLDADGDGGINQIFGTVHYLQPGGSSLKTRKVYTTEQLHAEVLKENNEEAYKEQKVAGYLAEVNEDSPAVISINTQISAFAVNEFLARIHPYRDDPNSEYAVYRYSFNQGEIYKENDGASDLILSKFVGKGTMKPFLNMPRLTK